MRRFSTRPFRSMTGSRSEFGRGRGEVRASKSLMEDEAELSDWVSELRDDSFRGRQSSEDELDGDRGRRIRGRDRDRGSRDSYSVKRRRGDSDSNPQRTRNPIGSRSRDSQINRRFDSRRDDDNGEVFSRRRRPGFEEGRLSSNSSMGNRGGRDMEFGYDRNQSKGLMKDGKDSRKQVRFMDEDNDKADEGNKFGIGDLLSEEDSDIDEEEEDKDNDNVLLKEVSAKSSAGATTGKSESYLSETR